MEISPSFVVARHCLSVDSGMEQGMNQSYAALDRLLATRG